MRVRKALLQFLVYFVVGFLLGAFQTAFWPDFFHWIPTPLCWLTVFVYLSLYRDANLGFVTIYIISLAFSIFSVAPMGLTVFLGTLVFLLSRFLKNRVFWPGSSYFLALISGFVPVVFLVHLTASYFLERNPIAEFPFFRLVGEVISTVAMSLPLYWLFQKLDRWIEIEEPPERNLIHE